MKLWPYRLLAPLDAVCRHLNEKDHLLPILLRRYVGPLATFEHAGGEFFAYLKFLRDQLNAEDDWRCFDADTPQIDVAYEEA